MVLLFSTRHLSQGRACLPLVDACLEMRGVSWVSDTARFDDFYLLLGVAPTATEDEIYAAYRDRCFLLHPDRLAGVPSGARARAEQDIRRLNRAWEVLGDPVSRAAHDAWYHARYAVAPGASAAVAEAISRPSDHERWLIPRPARGALGALAGGCVLLVVAVVVALVGYRGRARVDAAVALLEPPVPVPTPPQMIADGGFEGSAGTWVLEGGFRLVDGAGRGGSRALRVPGEGVWSNAYTGVALALPGCYELTAWVRGSGDARVDVLTTDWQLVATLRVSRGPVWTRQAATFVTTRGGDFLVAVRDSEANAGLDLDDLRLTPCAQE